MKTLRQLGAYSASIQNLSVQNNYTRKSNHYSTTPDNYFVCCACRHFLPPRPLAWHGAISIRNYPQPDPFYRSSRKHSPSARISIEVDVAISDFLFSLQNRRAMWLVCSCGSANVDRKTAKLLACRFCQTAVASLMRPSPIKARNAESVETGLTHVRTTDVRGQLLNGNFSDLRQKQGPSLERVRFFWSWMSICTCGRMSCSSYGHAHTKNAITRSRKVIGLSMARRVDCVEWPWGSW